MLVIMTQVWEHDLVAWILLFLLDYSLAYIFLILLLCIQIQILQILISYVNLMIQTL